MNRLQIIVLILILFLSTFSRVTAASAQQDQAAALIAAVNALRQSRGLAPYQVDSTLMGIAQQHSDYQASIETSTHQHQDGSFATSQGLEENIAMGSLGFMTAEIAVNQIWTDDIHMRPMVGYPSGTVGAGAATGSGTVYYTLIVRPAGVEITPLVQTTPGSVPSVATIDPLGEMVTSTPMPDGSVYHIVETGEALWAIAISYGVTIDEIRTLNNLAPGSTEIFVGQKLLVRKDAPPPTITSTAPLVTLEPTTQSATRTPTATIVRMATATATPVKNPAISLPFELRINPGKILGVISLLMGLLVLAVVGFTWRRS
jgi:LysM repeat protein